MSTSRAGPQLAERVKPLPEQKWPSRLFEEICRRFLRNRCKLVVSGTIPKGDAPVLICANHASHIDSIAIMVASGVPFSSCALLAARDYFFKNGVALRIMTAFLTLIPVNRFGIRGFRYTLQSCRRYIASGGRIIVVFPEGTRGHGGSLRPFKRGPAVLAMKLRLPVVPVWISGTHDIMPKGRLFPRRGTVRIAFGEIVQSPDPDQPALRKILSTAMTSEIRRAVQTLAQSHELTAATRLGARQ